MDPAQLAVLTILVAIEYVVGIAINICILTVYIRNLQNGLLLGPSDKVHLTKALVNISLHLSMAAQCIINVFLPQLLLTNEALPWTVITNTFLTFYSYWLTAVLSVYYCTNITTCGHHIFAWLKRSLSSYLLHILLGSGLGSVTICVPIFWFCSIESPGNSTDQFRALKPTLVYNVAYRTATSILGCFLPFTIALVSTAFTSWSLLHHMWRMKQNNPGFTRSKFQTQINATRTMILFLLISLIYSVIQMFFNSMPPSTSDVVIIIVFFVITSYPISEAVIIIQSSSKLRKTLLGKIFDRKRRNSEAET